MRLNKIVRLISPLFAILLSISHACAQSCPDVPSEHEPIVASIRTLFAAAEKDDYALFRKTLTPDFYAYDGGRRFDGVALLDFLKTEFQDKGYVYRWSVTDTSVHMACDTAWVTYVNVGSVTDPSGKLLPMEWLESVILEKHDGRWLVRFVHSTRASESAAGTK
jgi:ketosteroid isomerase-like protein